MSDINLKKIGLHIEYTLGGDTIIKLPDDKTIKDIKNVFVKYDTLTIEFNDNSEFKQELNSEQFFIDFDMKHPSDCKLLKLDNEDNIIE